MPESEFIDRLAEVLADLTPDVLEPVLDALTDLAGELGTLDHDDVMKLLGAAISGAVGAAVKHQLANRRDELDAAVRRALAAL